MRQPQRLAILEHVDQVAFRGATLVIQDGLFGRLNAVSPQKMYVGPESESGHELSEPNEVAPEPGRGPRIKRTSSVCGVIGGNRGCVLLKGLLHRHQ